MLSGSSFRWYARRQVNNWDVYDGWVREFATALLQHPEELATFNGKDASHYRIGRNPSVRFVPNFYPVLAGVDLTLPWNQPNTAGTTMNENYKTISWTS